MAPTHSKHKKKPTTKNRTRLLKLAIGLKRPEKVNEGKHNKKIKCRTNPGDTDNTTYKISMDYFRDGNPVERILFKKKLTRCMTRQNATGRATKYALARQLFAGCALADFNNGQWQQILIKLH